MSTVEKLNKKHQPPETFLKTAVTLDGETRTVEEWCVLKGLRSVMVYRRRTKNWSWAEAFQPKMGAEALRKIISADRVRTQEMRRDRAAQSHFA